MGNTCSGGYLPESSSKLLVSVNRYLPRFPYLDSEHKLPSQSVAILSRILQSKQYHLVSALGLLQSRQEKLLFLQRLEDVNLQLLDSMYYNLVANPSKEIKSIEPYTSTRLLSDQNTIERYKEVGIQTLKKSQVAILILAGGAGHNFTQGNKELTPIRLLPSKKSLIQLQVDRCQSIAQLMQIRLTVIIMLNETKDCIRTFLNSQSYPGLEIEYVHQYDLGAMDRHGRVLMKSPKNFLMFPNGNGDFLSTINDRKLFSVLKQKGVEYLYVCPSINICDPMVDCVALGYLCMKKLDIVGKCMTQAAGASSLSKIMLIDKRLYIADKRETDAYLLSETQVPDEKAYNESKSFTNSAVFRIDFLTNLLNDQHWNYSFGRSYRAKQITAKTFNPDKQTYETSRGFVFQKDMTDLFWFTKNIEILEIEGDTYFPIISNHGPYSMDNGAKVLSDQHKRWLNLNNSNLQEICEVSAQLSVWGENLEDISSQLMSSVIQYPLHVYNI